METKTDQVKPEPVAPPVVVPRRKVSNRLWWWVLLVVSFLAVVTGGFLLIAQKIQIERPRELLPVPTATTIKEDPATAKLRELKKTDDLTTIEADLRQTDLSGIDRELEAIDKELRSVTP